MSCQTCCHQFPSKVECSILYANGEPAVVSGSEIIEVNNTVGILVNKEEHDSFKGPVALSSYPINHDVRWFDLL